MDEEEADFGDNFFGEEDEAPVDMEAVREGMKLVPLSDVCFGEPDDVIGVETSIRNPLLSPLQLMLSDQVDYQVIKEEDDGVHELEVRRKSYGAGGRRAGLELTKMDNSEKDINLDDVGGVTAKAAKVAAEIDAHVVTGGIVAEAGPRPDFSLWTVEDDILLKNAMEAGAAVEALAKGAVRFSHRFTVRELRERWRALLYDPEISAQAAMRMVKAEVPFTSTVRLTRLRSVKDRRQSLRIRRMNSVRTHYYRTRKKITAERFFEHSLPSLNKEGAEFMSVIDKVATTAATENLINELQGEIEAPGEIDPCSSFVTVKASMNPTKSQAAEGSFLCKSSNEAVDASQGSKEKGGGLERIDVSSGILDSPMETVIHSIPDIIGTIMQAVEFLESDYHSDEVDKASLTTPHVEQMICVLNTEDTDIPSPPLRSDEGVLSPSLRSLPYSPLEGDENDSSISGGIEVHDNLEVSMQTTYASTLYDSEDNNISLRMTAKVEPIEAEPFSHNQDHETTLYVDAKGVTDSMHTGMLDQSAFKNEREALVSFKDVGIHVSRSCGIVSTCASQGSLHGNSRSEDPNRPAICLSNLYPVKSQERESELALASQVCALPQSEQGSLPGDQAAGISTSSYDVAGLQSNNEECMSSEDEMASFSDVEAMILDMDLDPGDDEDFSARAESRRIYKQHRKTIVRLEQGANASLQRTLTLHGAIAIFYGRHLKYYITKNEVSLGRVTQDINVDIDLGKEGRANKVSRRQANIKLEEDGVFYLKNLGRRALSVNNDSIATNQRASLGSNCLIEVGGMKFVFEMNQKLVKQRVDQMIYGH